MGREGQIDRMKPMVAFRNSAKTPKNHSKSLTAVRRQKNNAVCVGTILRSHKEVPWVDSFRVPLSRLVINFADWG